MADYYGDLYAGVRNKLGKAKQQSVNALTGMYAGAQREGEGDISLGAQRGGYLGSPVESALKRKFAAKLTGEKGQQLAGIENNYLNQQGQMEMNQAQLSAQERMQRDIANQNMWGNVLGGAGSLLGTVGKLFKWF